MRYVLNLAYLLLIAVFSPWLLYCVLRKGKYREGLAAKFLGRVPRSQPGTRCVWLHAVSVGEVNVLAPLLVRLEQQHPEWECVISTTTKTGFTLARKKYAPRRVFYCPLDFSWAVDRAMRRIRPEVLILAELELWPNLIGSAKRHGAKVAVINGRLSEHSARGYGRIRRLIGPTLKSIDLFAVQNQEYAERFCCLGVDERNVRVTGSVKFDGAQTDRDNPKTRHLASLWGLEPEDVVFLAGSTQALEEELALRSFLELAEEFPQLKLIITPRHPERFNQVADLIQRSGAAWQRRSMLRDAHRASASRILLVDAVGELGAWWGTAQVAYVGGSMGKRGGQNMIEPAAYGAAVSFGPRTGNFRDVVAMLLDRQAAHVVRDGAEMTAFVRRCLEDSIFAAELGEQARQLVRQQLGAADRTCQLIARLMSSDQSPGEAWKADVA